MRVVVLAAIWLSDEGRCVVDLPSVHELLLAHRSVLDRDQVRRVCIRRGALVVCRCNCLSHESGG